MLPFSSSASLQGRQPELGGGARKAHDAKQRQLVRRFIEGLQPERHYPAAQTKFKSSLRASRFIEAFESHKNKADCEEAELIEVLLTSGQ